MLHSATADPFKLALYKLMGKIDPSRRSVPQVTTTTEDWLWFQLAMVGWISLPKIFLTLLSRLMKKKMVVFELSPKFSWDMENVISMVFPISKALGGVFGQACF
jgi:hypothetical protein